MLRTFKNLLSASCLFFIVITQPSYAVRVECITQGKHLTVTIIIDRDKDTSSFEEEDLLDQERRIKEISTISIENIGGWLLENKKIIKSLTLKKSGGDLDLPLNELIIFLRDNPKLTVLDLTDYHIFEMGNTRTIEDIEKIVVALKRAKNLDTLILRNTGLNRVSAIMIAEGLLQIRVLDIGKNIFRDKEEFFEVLLALTRHPNLKLLQINGCSYGDITQEPIDFLSEVAKIFENNTKIESIDMLADYFYEKFTVSSKTRIVPYSYVS